MVWLTISDTEIAFDQVQLYTYSHVTLTKTRLIRGHACKHTVNAGEKVQYSSIRLSAPNFSVCPQKLREKNTYSRILCLCARLMCLYM